jgi:hypothetical protein
MFYRYKKSLKIPKYQRGNQNPYIEKEQTTLWPKENVQKGKQRSTKHYTKNLIQTMINKTLYRNLRCTQTRCNGEDTIQNTKDLTILTVFVEVRIVKSLVFCIVSSPLHLV